MAIKGSLKEASLADVSQLLAMGQKTGCLSVTDRSKFGQIYFDRGRITFATVVNRRDRLGDLLLRDGLIHHDELMDVIEQQGRDPEKRLGEILIARGFLTPQQLEQYIRLQIEEAVYSLFTWVSGTFYFEVDQRPENTDFLISLNPESLLLEGARRVDEWSQIEKKIPSMDLLFQVDRERLTGSEVALTQEQERIVPLLDGERTVQEVIDATALGEFEVGQALYGLIQAGFAHRVGRRSANDQQRAREAEVIERRNLGVAFFRTAMYEDAAREFRRLLELRPKDTTAIFHIALIALAEGRHREAVQRFQEVLERTGPRFGAFLNLAHALQRLGRADDALLVLNEAEAIRPGAPEVALARGTFLLRTGNHAEARAALEEHRKRLPADGSPAALFYHERALVEATAGDLDAAAARVQEGLEEHPGSAPLLLLAGAVAERRGDYERAERHFRHAAEEDPSLAHAHKNLGDLAYRRGEHDEAAEHYRRAAQLAPSLGDDLYTKLGNIHFKRMNTEQAVRSWQKALELNPANEVVRNNLTVAAHAAG
jgi:tetratricopeptide (TPR) repeat protein